MQIFIRDSYEEISLLAAEHMTALLENHPSPLVCVASGDSPAGLYKELRVLRNNGRISVGSWLFLGLDEWLGMNGADEGSCRFHLDQQFFSPMQIAPEKISFFDGRSKDLQGECNLIEELIKEKGPLALTILGLGLNGHIGMNEPGTPVGSRTHIAELEAETAKVGQKYFSSQRDLSGGLTLGIGTIMESEQVFLIVSGKHKASIVQKILEGAVSEELPATILREHKGARIYLDRDAASLLSNSQQ